ncbi:ankyrin, partial [Phlegmacium glaucopus]
MKIFLSRISGESVDDIKKFMEKVDDDVRRLSSNDAVTSTVSTLGQVLKLTKTIMDQLSQVHPILKASWTIVSTVYQAVQETDLQDESIRELAITLREMLGTANAIPDLPVIPHTTDVIEAISRQSLQVASLIHEYTKLPWIGRTVKIQIPGDLKSRIDKCQKSCAALKDDFYSRLHLDTNTQVKETGRRLEAIKDDTLAKTIHSWLSPPDSSRNWNEAYRKRQVDTCSWFLESERFLKWRETPGFLWVKGKPGCGKSVLCSSIVDNLLQLDPSLGIAYFFFDGRDSQTELQSHYKLIRSLISQFSDKRYGGIPIELVNLHRKYGAQQPLDSQLQDTLRDILDRFSHAYIVIDALDECIDRKETLNWVNELVMDTDRKTENLHIVVTSRPLPDVETVFGRLDLHSVNVVEATANRDIVSYLNLQMESKFKGYDEETLQTIKSGLTEGADGSFRWVALQLAALERCSSTYEIMQQLADLPDGLDETYKRILKEIDRKYRADTRTFLQWLAFSNCSITIPEIAEAITVDFASEDGPVFNLAKRYINPRDVLVRCSSLVDESEGTIRLSHFSVKEYLLSTRVEKDFSISEETSHSKITEISVAYLLQFDSFLPLTKAMLVSSPLAQYAADYWINHAKSGGMGPTVLKLILRLFTSETGSFTNWIRICNIDVHAHGWDRQDLSMDKSKVCSPLYYASLAGMQPLLDYLLEKGVNVNAKEGRLGSALQAASSGGHEAIVKLLLEKGADVNAQGGLGSALLAASFGGHEVIVKLLLEKGANVNTQGELGSALHAGFDVTTELLERGVYVNAEGYCGEPLQAASSGGHEAIVKLLFEKGANVNAQGYYGTALHAASSKGHEAIVKLLLEKGANVNVQGYYNGDALQAASYEGQEVIIKLLLEKGADVNAQGGHYGNAL